MNLLGEMLGGVLQFLFLAVPWTCVSAILWQAFKIVRRPEFGPVLTPALMVLLYDERLKSDQAALGALIWVCFISIPSWRVGAEWRAGRQARKEQPSPVEPHPGRAAADARIARWQKRRADRE